MSKDSSGLGLSQTLPAPCFLPSLPVSNVLPVLPGGKTRSRPALVVSRSPPLVCRTRKLRDLLPAGERGRLHLQRRPHHQEVGRADRAVPAGVPRTHVHREQVGVGWGPEDARQRRLSLLSWNLAGSQGDTGVGHGPLPWRSEASLGTSMCGWGGGGGHQKHIAMKVQDRSGPRCDKC